jgi:hypothetical protein
MNRFVILQHDHPELHWDFMLEDGAVLKTWRLAQMPSQPGETIAALRIGDHRLAYLDYEGPVSGNRGRVMQREKGVYELMEGSLAGDRLMLRLEGNQLRGEMILNRVEDQSWTLHIQAQHSCPAN